MNKFLTRARFALPLAVLAIAIPAVAQAAPGVTDSRVALRAGPGGDYPRVITLDRNTRVNIHGCIRRYDWCDVTARGVRGWVPADEVMLRYQGRPVRVREYGPRVSLPTLTFSFDTYWTDNYRRSNFYRDRDRYRQFWSRDQDRDGVPNGFDRDRDGDGIRNNRDRDGDGVPNNRDRNPNSPRADRVDRDLDNDGVRNSRDRDRDGDGVINNRDQNPNNPRNSRIDRDLDNDGVRNNRDADRDGDGVRNRNDPAPNNPRRDR